MILDKFPNGFFSVDDLVKVLHKHTAKNPIFDLKQAVKDVDYMQVARNFRLGVVKQNKEGEWYSDSSVYAVIPNSRDLEVLKDEIKKAYKRITGETVEPEKKVTKVSTQVDDLTTFSEQPRTNTKSKSKYGDKIVSGSSSNQAVESTK